MNSSSAEPSSAGLINISAQCSATILAVSPWQAQTLWLCFGLGQTVLVNLKNLIAQDDYFALLEDKTELEKVGISPEGDAVEWPSGIVLDAKIILSPNGHPAKPFETTLIGKGAVHAILMTDQKHPTASNALAGMLRHVQEEYGINNEWYPNLIYDLYQLSQSDYWTLHQLEFMQKVAFPVLAHITSLGRIPRDTAKKMKYMCHLYVGLPSGDWFLVEDIKVKAPVQSCLTEQAIGYLKREAVETLELRLKRQERPYNFIAFKSFAPLETGMDLL